MSESSGHTPFDRTLFDTECYPNYWSCGVRLPDGTILQFRIVGRNTVASQEEREQLYSILTSGPIGSFNGIAYDIPMICAYLSGYSCAQLHDLSTMIIRKQIKLYQIDLPVEWKPDNHIDAMCIMPMKPASEGDDGDSNSQKYIAGVIHCREMRDLPFDPEMPLNPKQIAQLEEYNENDLEVLYQIFTHKVIIEAIALREFMTKEYGIDLMNKSDAQMSEAIIYKECGSPRKQEARPDEIHFKYDPPSYLSYGMPELNAIVEKIQAVDFTGNVSSIGVLKGLTVEIAGMVYRLGKGGLHSSEKNIMFSAGPGELIIDIDVASYYPNMMRVAGAVPELLGDKFLTVLVGLIERRLHAKAMQKKCKKEGDYEGMAHWENINLGLKICINGCFGKTGSRWSVLFAPKMMIQTTITGQLLLLMLIELFKDNNIQVLSANTDGIVTKVTYEQYQTLRDCVEWWEDVTGLEMEMNSYNKLWSLDVNNYMASYALERPEDTEFFTSQYGDDAGKHTYMFAKKPGCKRKGRFAPANLLLKKAPNLEVVYDALTEYFMNGTPIEETIVSCTDIRKFVVIKNCSGKAYIMPKVDMKNPDAKSPEMEERLLAFGWEKVKRGWWSRDGIDMEKTKDAYLQTFPSLKDIGGEFLGSKIRWYHSCAADNMVINLSRGAKVAGGENVASAMLLPDELPEDIDYSFYIDFAYKTLETMRSGQDQMSVEEEEEAEA